MKRPGLGRGLSALIDDSARASGAPPGSAVRMVRIELIRANPNQPRRLFDPSDLADLTDSIIARGVLQPILLRNTGGGGVYELVAGERRWRAAKAAGLTEIPALIRDDDEIASAELAIIENVQRADLNPIEEARAYARLVEQHGHRHEDLGTIVGKSRSHITNLLRLNDLPEPVQALVESGQLSMGHARALAGADDPVALADQVIADGLNVRQTEALVRGDKPVRTQRGRATGRSDAPRVAANSDEDLAALEARLGDALGLKVTIGHQGGKGQVAIAYASLDELDLICQRLSGEPI